MTIARRATLGVMAVAAVAGLLGFAPIDDPTARILEESSRLDEQAQRAPTADERRALWLDAIKKIDAFLINYPKAEAAPTLRFQAAVFGWARGKTLLDQVDLSPADDPDRLEAAADLDDTISRLRALRASTEPNHQGDPIAQNIRFRLAQALADRARLRPELDPARQATEREAQALLDRSIDLDRLKGFAILLRAELSNRLGMFAQAQLDLAEGEKLSPPPSPQATLPIKLRALIGREVFDEADRLVDAAKLPAEATQLWKIRILLARRQALPIGPARRPIEAELFDRARQLRDLNKPESARGLMELAGLVDEPPADAPADAWEMLAEGRLRAGEPARAGRLLLDGAARAEALGQFDRAGEIRSKAGACFFEGNLLDEADAALSSVRENPSAPRAVRARSGMLLALARGRALADRRPGASRPRYVLALESQVRDFGDDPSTAEARWLLGKVQLANGRKLDAARTWLGIDHGLPRWLEATSGAIDLLIDDLDAERIGRDPSAIEPRRVEAGRAIDRASREAVEGAEAVEIGMRAIRLDLLPGVGNPARALERSDQLLRSAARPDQHRQAKLARMVALAELNRFVDAETIARGEAESADLAPVWPAVRLIDRAASETDSDTARRKLGQLLLTLLSRRVDNVDQITPENLDEFQLRLARAFLFSGNAIEARKVITRWGGMGRSDRIDLLRDLAETYLKLDANPLAIEVERLRASKLAPGSAGWFDARYGLALALARSNRGAEAGKVIEATKILHPGLGGPDLRARFDRLGQKVAAGGP